MKLSRLNKMIAGVIIILTGIGLFLDSLNIISFNLFHLWPIALVYLGVRWWENGKRVLGAIFAGMGGFITLSMLGMIELVMPLAFIYFGFRLIRSRKPSGADRYKGRDDQAVPPPVYHSGDEESLSDGTDTSTEERTRAGLHQGSSVRTSGILLPKDSRSSLIGDFHLTSGRFELSHLHIWHGVGNVVIDLSRALIMQEEALLVVDGWVGDVTIYVPVDLPVAISAEVTVGDLEVFGNRQGGLNRYLAIRSQHYEQAAQKVKLNISLIVGDIDVKYI